MPRAAGAGSQELQPRESLSCSAYPDHNDHGHSVKPKLLRSEDDACHREPVSPFIQRVRATMARAASSSAAMVASSSAQSVACTPSPCSVMLTASILRPQTEHMRAFRCGADRFRRACAPG